MNLVRLKFGEIAKNKPNLWGLFRALFLRLAIRFTCPSSAPNSPDNAKCVSNLLPKLLHSMSNYFLRNLRSFKLPQAHFHEYSEIHIDPFHSCSSSALNQRPQHDPTPGPTSHPPKLLVDKICYEIFHIFHVKALGNIAENCCERRLPNENSAGTLTNYLYTTQPWFPPLHWNRESLPEFTAAHDVFHFVI